MNPIFSRTSEISLATLVSVGTLLCVFPQESFYFKWWEDHAFIFMLTLFGAGLLFFFFNVFRMMMVCFGACALLCLVLDERSQVPLRHAEKTEDPTITIGQFELPRVESQEDEHLTLILNTRADIISLQEVEWNSLEKVHEFFTCCGYPYYECMENELRNTAMVVYSRYPFSFISQLNDPNALGILGKIERQGKKMPQELVFFSAFLNPVKDEKTQGQLRKRLQNYAQNLNMIDKPLLACGDYHLVSWSKDLAVFRTAAGLNESRRGPLPTSPHRYFSLFDFPFDHIFYSDHFKCISFETISSTTAPHLGIVGTYQFENQDSIVNVKTTAQEF